jgi:hypothetical protein
LAISFIYAVPSRQRKFLRCRDSSVSNAA